MYFENSGGVKVDPLDLLEGDSIPLALGITYLGASLL